MKNFLICMLLLNSNFIVGQNVLNMKQIEEYLTINSNIKEEYFLTNLEKDDSELSHLFYIYWLIKKDEIKKARELFEKRTYLEEKGFKNFILALLSLEDKDLEKAQFYFDSAYKLNPENKWLNLELFFFKIAQNEDFEAFKFLENAIDIDPYFHEAIIERSLYYDPIDNCKEIIRDLEKIPETYVDFRAYYWLGTAYLNCLNFPKTSEYLQKSIAIQESSEAFLALANFYIQTENTDAKVIESFKRSIELDPNNSHAVSSFGWFLFDKGDTREAEEMLLNLLKQSSDQEIHNQIIQFYINLKNYTKAKKHIELSEQDNGENFMNQGYKILLASFEGNPYQQMAKEFKLKYNDFELNWLKDLLLQFEEKGQF